MNAEELDEYRKLLCLIDESGNDFGSIADFEAFALGVTERYGSAEAFAVFGPDVKVWEFPLFNAFGQWGPDPKVGTWTQKGYMVACRPMTKDEQLAELFPSTASDWRTFRAWLKRENPLEFRCLDRWAESWS